MGRPKAQQEAESDTTVVNIADFQRTRDSERLKQAIHPTKIYSWFNMKEFVTHNQDQRVRFLHNEKLAIQHLNRLKDDFSSIADTIASSSVDHKSVAKTFIKVIVALATLQNSVKDLSTAYINHANTVLNPGRAGTLDLNLTTTLLDSGLLTTGPAPGVKVEAAPEAKKKRKRAAHDPNAPKRALTPYFLYMQSARPRIALELGANAKPKEVADEGTRRWSVMHESDKRVWNAAYQKNLAIYRVKTAAYKAGNPVPEDAEAEKIAKSDVKVALTATADEVEVDSDAAGSSSADSEPEPVKAPSPPKSNKRRKTNEKRAVTPVKETAKAAKASPEKKGKKGKKDASPPPAKTSDKKKKTKKAA